MKLKLILLLLIVISSLIIGCVEIPKSTTSKNIIPETISEISQKILVDCGTTIQCDNWIETHVNGKYVRWNGTVSDAKDNVLVVSVVHHNLIRDGRQDYMPPSVPVYLYDLSKNELLKFKNGDKVQFIGKINIKKSSPPYNKEYSSVWASMMGISPFGEKLELYDATIEQPNVSK